VIQPIGRKRHRVPRRVEEQRSPEETAERPEIVRLAVSKSNLEGLPGRAAQGAQDTEHGGNCTIPGLIGCHGAGLIDLAAQDRQVAVQLQVRECPADVEMQETHEAA
jgi:hypothetical protein